MVMCSTGRLGCRCVCFFFSSRRRHTRSDRDWSSDVCSSDLTADLIDDTNANLLNVVDPTTGDRIVMTGIVKNSLAQYFTGAKRFNDPGAEARTRSEERRVGKECRSRWSPYH